jgi:ADP-ribose pyrophosphatase
MSSAQDLPLDQNGNPILLQCKFFKVIDQKGYFVITEDFDVNAAVIIAQNEKGQFLVVRHFRPAIGKVSIEFPRGGRKPNETTQGTAIRELHEETGYSAELAQRVGSLHSNTSLIRSSVDVYAMSGLKLTDDEQDGEIESLCFLSRKELNALILDGEVTDAHTLSGLALFDVYMTNQVDLEEAL